MPPKKMQRETFHLSVGSKEYPAVLVVPPALRSSGLVIATHGAGGDHNIKSLEHLSEYLVGRGIACLRFTCAVTQLKTRVSVFKSAVTYARSSPFKFTQAIVAGRSMGSRAAMQFVTDDTTSHDFVKGVAALAYPLHRPGGAEGDLSVRRQMLLDLPLPSLLVSGDRDAMCDLEKFMPIHANMKISPEFCKLEGGDHSFAARKKDPYTTEQLLEKQGDAVVMFCTDLFGDVPGGKRKRPTGKAEPKLERYFKKSKTK